MDDVVRVMCPGFRFVCLLDGVVAAIYPRLLPQIKAFYAGRGQCLAALTRNDALEQLDRKIALRIRACALIAQQVAQSHNAFRLEDVVRSLVLAADSDPPSP